MKVKRRIYVLWYEDGGDGWPTSNTAEERLENSFTSREAAKLALKNHNRLWPEDKKEMSIKIFEEVSK